MATQLFIGYATAAYILLRHGLDGLRKSHATPAIGTAPSARRAAELRAVLELPEESRLDVCIIDENDKRNGKALRSHKCRYAAPGDYLSLSAAEGVFIATPALTFLQLAETLTVPALVLLGLELCGTCVSDDGRFIRSKPLTSKDALTQYVSDHSGERGAAKALEALRYIADNSASPRESQLVALLCLPRKWGGYGFPMPLLNERIDLTTQQQRVLRKNHLRCDLLWPGAQLAIEYDSNTFHAGATKINDDSLRRNVLRSAGITVIDITNTQLKKAEAFHETAIQVDHCLGVNALAKRKASWLARNQELRTLVLVQQATDRLL